MPALGTEAMIAAASSLLSTASAWQSGDVPNVLKIGSKSIPLGRTLLRKLRDAVGFDEEYIAEIQERIGYETSRELLLLLANYENDTSAWSPRSAFVAANAQKVKNIEAKTKLFLRGSL